MIKDKKILIVGAGGFIGGHLVKRLLKDGNSIVAVDIKPKEYWFQDFVDVENHYSMDMKDIINCRKVAKNIPDTVILSILAIPIWRACKPDSG